MYDFRSIKLKVNKEDITEISEIEIWGIFFPHIKFNKAISSPLRQDKTPSFVVYTKNSRILWKDFARGKSGDIYALLQEKLNLDFNSVVKLIKSKVKPEYKPITSIPTKPLFKYCSFKREYNHLDKAYWVSGGITLTTLNKFNVEPVRELYYITNEHQSKIYQYDSADPCYLIKGDMGEKYYRPFNNKYKWSGTMKSGLNGWNLLDYSKKVVFIASSCKDAMVLHECGYNSLYPSAEGNILKAEDIEKLKPSFKVVLFYDNDVPGITYAMREAFKHNITYYHTHENLSEKDCFDYSKQYGIDNFRELINFI